MGKLLKFSDLSEETKNFLLKDAEENPESAVLLEKAKDIGISEEEWCKVFTVPVKDFAENEQIKSDEVNSFFESLKKTFIAFEEKTVRVIVRKRNKSTGRLDYLRGGSMQWNLEYQTYEELLDEISRKFGDGDYHLTFQPVNRESRIKPITKMETISGYTNQDFVESQPQMAQYQVQSKDDVASVIEKTLSVIVNMFNQMQMQTQTRESEFKEFVSKITESQNTQIAKLAEVLKTEQVKHNPNLDIGKMYNDMFAMFDKITEKMQPKQQVNVEDIIDKRLKQHQDAIRLGMEIASSGSGYVEEEEEEEGEEDTDKPIGEIVEEGLKDVGSSTIKEAIKGLFDLLKPSGVEIQTGKTPVKSKEEVPENIIGALEQFEDMLSKNPDDKVLEWLKENIAPSQAKFMKSVAPDVIVSTMKQYRPSLVKYADRIVKLIKML